jgi:hypothetical protein
MTMTNENVANGKIESFAKLPNFDPIIDKEKTLLGAKDLKNDLKNDFKNQKKNVKSNDLNVEANANENLNIIGKNVEETYNKENDVYSNSKFAKMRKEDRIREELQEVTDLTDEEIEKLVSQLMKSKSERRKSLRKEQINGLANQIREQNGNKLNPITNQ